MASPMPRLVSPRGETIEMVRAMGGGFDADMWHVVQARDTELIADEIAHGVGSPIFVYSFDIGGKRVAGISVIGQQHLATHYGGLRHVIVSSVEKRGTVIYARRYVAVEGMPIGYMSLPAELASEPDFYDVTVEITDVKTGNSVQCERREFRFESRRDGSQYERPNYQTIAQSKARRNGYGMLIPQEMQHEFLERNLKLDRNKADLTESLIAEKRSSVLRFASARGIPIDRQRLGVLTLDQIAGLGDAARAGEAPAFSLAAVALGLTMDKDDLAPPEPDRPSRRAGRPPRAQRSEPPIETPPEESPPDEPPEPSGRRSALFE